MKTCSLMDSLDEYENGTDEDDAEEAETESEGAEEE